MKKKMINYIKKNKFEIILVLIFIVISFTCLFFHEPWSDETHGWNLAKNYNFVELINQMKYEGHLALWYLICRILVILKLPMISMNIISFIFVLIFVILFIKNSPFNKKITTLIVLSSPVLYLYPVVARCYSLIPLAILLICINYKNRHYNPLKYILSILLLCNTHVLMFGLVGILSLEFFIEEIKLKHYKLIKNNVYYFKCLFILIIGIILCILPLFNCLNFNTDVNTSFNLNLSYIIYKLFMNSLLLIIEMFFSSLSLQYAFVILMFLIYLWVVYFIYNKKNALMLLLSILYNLIIYSFIYPIIFPERACIILFIIILFLFRNYNKSKINFINRFSKIIIYLLLIFNVICSFIFVFNDIKYNYSDTYNLVNYLNNNIKNNSIIITSESYAGDNILAYTNKYKIYNLKNNKYYKVLNHNELNGIILDQDKIINQIRCHFNNIDLYYLYYDKYGTNLVNDLENEGIFKLIYETNKKNMIKETIVIPAGVDKYKLYKINKSIFNDMCK